MAGWGNYPENHPLSGMSQFYNNSGGLKDSLKLGNNSYNTGQGFINQLSGRAFSKGPSNWANLQNQAIDTQMSMGRDQVSRDAAAAYGGGLSNLAASGGFDAGSRERLAGSSGLARLQGLQNVSAQGNMARNQIGIADEQMKMDLAKQLPGMQLQQAGFKAGLDQFDINNQIGMGKFGIEQGIKYQSSKELADATAKANQKNLKWFEKPFSSGDSGWGYKASAWGKKVNPFD